MVRSASDATRFTATIPTASSKPPPPSSRIQNLGRGALPGETPQQKIARLRAAAAATRAGKESQFDKVVRVGRRFADGAHRATAYSLIGLTGKILSFLSSFPQSLFSLLFLHPSSLFSPLLSTLNFSSLYSSFTTPSTTCPL